MMMVIIHLNADGLFYWQDLRSPLRFVNAYAAGIVSDDEGGRCLEIRQCDTGLFLKRVPLSFIERAEFEPRGVEAG